MLLFALLPSLPSLSPFHRVLDVPEFRDPPSIHINSHIPSPAEDEEKTPSPADGEEKTPPPADGEEKTPSPPDGEEKTPPPAHGEEKTPPPPNGEEKTPSPTDDKEKRDKPSTNQVADNKEEKKDKSSTNQAVLALRTPFGVRLEKYVCLIMPLSWLIHRTCSLRLALMCHMHRVTIMEFTPTF